LQPKLDIDFILLSNFIINRYKIQKFIFVAIGAVPGALLRWQINNDLIVNSIGSLLIGVLIGAGLKERFRLILGVGFCGSCTTFSGWIFDVFSLFINQFYSQAIELTFHMLSWGLFAALGGFLIGNKVKRYLAPS
tara:strand:- start:218 stop:622 length:405 start_codon:yes stop_codon:yes gene_type:complete